MDCLQTSHACPDMDSIQIPHRLPPPAYQWYPPFPAAVPSYWTVCFPVWSRQIPVYSYPAHHLPDPVKIRKPEVSFHYILSASAYFQDDDYWWKPYPVFHWSEFWYHGSFFSGSPSLRHLPAVPAPWHNAVSACRQVLSSSLHWYPGLPAIS